ncbi:MAG: mini-circle protein [Frondihabitans sp.]|nr:mini-circle protein [Frondihabitans sp.]
MRRLRRRAGRPRRPAVRPSTSGPGAAVGPATRPALAERLPDSTGDAAQRPTYGRARLIDVTEPPVDLPTADDVSRAAHDPEVSVTEVEGAAGELATLREFLGYMRDGVIKKTNGAPDDALRRAGVMSGISVAWVVTHLAVSERFWFCGMPVDDWSVMSTPPPGVPFDAVLDDYRRAIEEADAVIGEWNDLDQILTRPPNGHYRSTARWVFQHMITETARHAGHADILREQIDGVVGR